mgnify:CR=1 FL=1
MTGKIECGHCNGYGSSWNDEGDVRCSQCGGTGLVTDLSQPLSGVIYNLIAGPNTPAISNGNTWEESRVSNK